MLILILLQQIIQILVLKKQNKVQILLFEPTYWPHQIVRINYYLWKC